MIRVVVIFALLFSGQLAFGQRAILDSLYMALQKHPELDTNRVKLLTGICYYEYTSDNQKNKLHADEALEISTNIGYKKGIGLAQKYLALHYWMAGDRANAIQHAFDMLRTAEGISNYQGVGQACQLIGNIYAAAHDDEMAVMYYKRGVSVLQSANRKRDLGYAYNAIGVFYMNRSKYDEASFYYFKAIETRKEIDDQDGLVQSYANLGELYTDSKNYHQALAYFQRALPPLEALQNKYRLAAVYDGIGSLYVEMGAFDKAEESFMRAISLARSIHHKEFLQQIYGNFLTLETKRGRYQNALAYQELEFAYHDSIFAEDGEKQIAEIQNKYEAERKDRTIKLLGKSVEIERLWTNILIASFVILINVVTGIYVMQRYRSRKNRQILNLEIDALSNQNKELTEKYKIALAGDPKKITESHDQRLLRKIIEVIENNLGDSTFGVAELAHEVGMSRSNLHRKTKLTTGFSPGEMIRSIRLRKASLLLLDQSTSVSDVGLAVGFEDHSYFARSFKKEFGVLPSEYVTSRNPK